jgi:hypothetical protein
VDTFRPQIASVLKVGKKTVNTRQLVKYAVLPNGEGKKNNSASFLSLGINKLRGEKEE